MSRKHYKQLAEALGVVFGQHADGTPEKENFAADVLEVIADAMKAENSNFDRARFTYAVKQQAEATAAKYRFGVEV
jgi:hypothetical protein